MLSSLERPFSSSFVVAKRQVCNSSVCFRMNAKLIGNFYSFVLKAMSLQYRNVMFAKVDVDDSQVRILNPCMGMHKIRMQCH